MPFDDTIPDVPQSDTDAIARRLMGDSLVDRYGDVIGARPTEAKDVLRDFTIGFSKGQEQVDSLHMKMQTTFRDEYNKAAERALAAKKADADKASAAWDAIKWAAEKAPRGYAAQMLKERLATLGFDPKSLSPTALKMLTDADWFAQLPTKEIDEAVKSNRIPSAVFNAYFTDPMQADKFRNDAVSRARHQADTDRLIQTTEDRARKAKEDRQKFRAWRQDRPLSIKNAQLRSENLRLTNEKLRKGASGGILERLLAGEGLGMEQAPESGVVEPSAQAQAVANPDATMAPSPLRPTPTADEVAGIKAKYGLK